VLETLRRIDKELSEELACFEPERVSGSDAACVLEVACAIERRAASLKLLATKRAAESRIWKEEGHRSAASWMAELSKSSYGEALGSIETAEQVAELPRTADALRGGALSRAQVKELAQVAYEHPEQEIELLRVAQEGSVRKLRDTARYLKAKAASKESEIARYRAVHRRRYLRHWLDPDGAFHLDARLTPDNGARLLASIQQEADLIFEKARESSDHEPAHAYAADALVALVTGERTCSTSKRTRSKRSHGATGVVRIDLAALERGYSKGTEICEIPGVGPVPVAHAKRVLGDCFLKLLVTDGVDVRNVCHVGRTIPAHLMSALEERDQACVVPGCEVIYGLEVHHWKEDFAVCKVASVDGVARVCTGHHDQITYEGFQLVGGPGKWKFIRAPGKQRPDT